MSRPGGAATRARILDTAERLVLRQGFSATTVDAVIGELGITKGAFFHHFGSKADLSLALVERYAHRDIAELHAWLARADELARDPLQRLLVFIGLVAQDADRLVGETPGCLYGSYVYEQQLFGEGVRQVVADAVLEWRRTLAARLTEVMAVHPPRIAVDTESLADTVLTAFEGAYVLARAVREPRQLHDQLLHVRNYLELLFEPADATGTRGGVVTAAVS